MKWDGLLILSGLCVAALGAAKPSDVAAKMLRQVKEGTITYAGERDWLYSKNELQHLAAGPLTEGRVKEVAKATRKDLADPIPAIVDFNEQLKKAGIKLIVVPVPPKLAVYPAEGLKVGEAAKYLQAFDAELTARGLDVLDLTPALIAARDRGVYCRQDSHWSPEGIGLAARKLAEWIGRKGNSDFHAREQQVKIVGDLQYSLNKDSVPSETLTLRIVDGDLFSEESPVLLLGDSHTLVFSAGEDMLAEHSGLGEQLAYELRMPIDRIGVKGSASTPVRVNLYRKAASNPDWLKKKEYVIWVFTCREFTESTNGWAKIPISKTTIRK